MNLKSYGLFVGSAGVFVIGIYIYNKRKRNKVSKKWKFIGEVTNIYLYPLKGGQPVELNSAECTFSGLRKVNNRICLVELRDRSFIIYHEKENTLINGDTYSEVNFLNIRQPMSMEDPRKLVFNAPGMWTLYVKIPVAEDQNVKKETIKVSKTEDISILDCGGEAALWISRFLLHKDLGLRIGFYSFDMKTGVSNSHMNSFLHANNQNIANFSDLTSYTVVNQSTIDQMKELLTTPVSLGLFGPNLVVRGVVKGEVIPALSENNWIWVQIGDVEFQKVDLSQKCECGIVSSDNNTRSAEVSVKLLEKLQESKNKLEWKHIKSICTVHLKVRNPGNIHVGDPVYIPES